MTKNGSRDPEKFTRILSILIFVYYSMILLICQARSFLVLQQPTRKIGDYILIDGMPSLGMMAINTLVAADSVMIPSQPSFLSAKGLDLLLHSITRVKRSINPKLKIEGILLTMVDSRTNNAKDIISSLQEGIGKYIRIMRTQIPFSVRASECSLHGKSIFTHDKNGKVAESYAALAKEVMQLERAKADRSRNDGAR